MFQPSRCFMSLRTAAAFMCCSLSSGVLARPGDLDLSFHGSGWIAIPMTPLHTGVSMVLQKDGKIVIAAHLGREGDPSERMTALRFGSDGIADTPFNTRTASVAQLVGTRSVSSKTVIQEDGRILLAGSTFSQQSVRVRLLTDGSPDPSFGAGSGIVIKQESPPWYGLVDMCLQRDGKILTGDFPFAVFRFDAGGLPDPGFGSGGRMEAPASGAEAGPIAELSDGKILVATRDLSVGGGGGGVRRFHSDGHLDTSFGTGGGFFHPNIYHLSRILPLTDGRILLAGRSVTGTDNRNFSVARILPGGTPDLSFNGTGWNSHDFDEYESVAGLASTHRGKTVLAGTVISIGGTAVRMGLACFRPDGTLDTDFGNGGTVLTSLDGAQLRCFDAVLAPGGKLLAAANYTGLAGQPDGILLARYVVSGPLEVRDADGVAVTGQPGTAPLDFGLVTLGSRSKQFTIRNDGLQRLSGISASLTGESHPGEFALSPRGIFGLDAGAQSPLVITFTPSTAPGLRTANLQILSNDPADTPLIVSLTGSRATPLQTWRITWFGSPDNSGAGADLNDFDHDGMVNLLEYATSSHPHQPSPPAGQLMKNGDTLTFTYSRPAAAVADLTYQPEAAVSPDGPWSTADISSSVINDNGVTQTVQATTPATLGRKFVRLRVTRL